MDRAEILNFVDQSSSATKEVFSLVVGSKSKATIGAAKDIALNLAKRLDVGLKFTLEKRDPLEVIQDASTEDFMIAASAFDVEQQQSLKYKVFIKPFKPFWIRAISFVFGLKADRLIQLSKESDQAYFDAGNGIVLAGLYLLSN